MRSQIRLGRDLRHLLLDFWPMDQENPYTQAGYLRAVSLNKAIYQDRPSPCELKIVLQGRLGLRKYLRRVVWKHVFHVFFIGPVVVILTTLTRLHTVELLSSSFTMKLIVALEGFVLGHKPAPWMELVFSFQVPEDQMILASLSIGWTVDLYSPRKTLARPVWVETMDLQSRPILIKDIKKILSREGIRNCIEGVLLLSLLLGTVTTLYTRLAGAELAERGILLFHYCISLAVNSIALVYKSVAPC